MGWLGILLYIILTSIEQKSSGNISVTVAEGKGYNNLYSLILKFHWPSSYMVMPNFKEEEVESYCIHKENILLTTHLPQYV